MNVSAYVDINSFLEDPWEDLVKKLNDSKDMNKSKELANEFLLDSKLADRDSAQRFGNKLLKDTNLDNSQGNQKCENEWSTNTSLEMQNTDLNQISQVNSLTESEIDNISSTQDSLHESTCSVNNKICEVKQENIYPSVTLIENIDQKNI